MRIRKKKLQQQSRNIISVAQPNLELNTYDSVSHDSKQIDMFYDDVKSKLGEEPSSINIDPIYEELHDVPDQRNDLWGPPPLPPLPSAYSFPLTMATKPTFTPLSPPPANNDSRITDEYIKMTSPGATSSYIKPDYENIKDTLNN